MMNTVFRKYGRQYPRIHSPNVIPAEGDCSSDTDYFEVGRFLMVERSCLLVFTSGDSILENRLPYFRSTMFI